MRFTTLLLPIAVFTFLYTASFSQSDSKLPEDANEFPYWIDMMQDQDANFYDVQKAFYTYWEGREITKGSGYKPFKRWEYMMQETRINPDGSRIAPDHIYNEYQHYLESHPDAKSRTNSWTSLGPEFIPDGKGYKGLGRLNAIAFHPTDPDIFYAGAPAGGLWKTTVGGNDWFPLTDDQPTLGVSSIVVSHLNPDVIFIGTGDRDAGDAMGMGVFRTNDGGATWMPWNTGMGNATVGRMIMHPTNHLIIYAATSSGVFKTVDGGATWLNKSSGNYKDIVFKPGTTDVLYAVKGASLYKSVDAGENFSQVTNGLPGGSRAVVGVTPANPDYVYLLITTSSSFKGLYRSTDDGNTFTTQSTSLAGQSLVTTAVLVVVVLSTSKVLRLVLSVTLALLVTAMLTTV